MWWKVVIAWKLIGGFLDDLVGVEYVYVSDFVDWDPVFSKIGIAKGLRGLYFETLMSPSYIGA